MSDRPLRQKEVHPIYRQPPRGDLKAGARRGSGGNGSGQSVATGQAANALDTGALRKTLKEQNVFLEEYTPSAE